MKNQYTLHNDYIRCIDLPTNNKINNSLPKFSFYSNATPPIIIIWKYLQLRSNSEERVLNFKIIQQWYEFENYTLSSSE